MKPLCYLLVLVFSVAAAGCDRSQPSGVPDTGHSSPAPEPAAPPPVQPPEQPPVRELKEPPPLDGDIPPFAKTGFPDCDSYIEEYRQCLNSRLAGEQRKAAAHDLVSSMNAIVGNISRGVEPSRIANRCKRSRRLAAPKVEQYGCTLEVE